MIPNITLPQLDPNAALNMLGMGQRPQASISPFQHGYSTMLSGSSRPAYQDGVPYMFDQLRPNPTATLPTGYGTIPQAMRSPITGGTVSPVSKSGLGGGGGGGVANPIGSNNGNGNTGGNGGMHPEEMKWKGIAEKIGLNWNVVKDVYMNPNRNGSPNPATAISRATDDKAWGDSAFKYGILNGDYWHDRQVWIDHYNAGGNMQYDPMAGHNDAIATYQANQNAIEQQVNGQAQAPEWYQPPAQ